MKLLKKNLRVTSNSVKAKLIKLKKKSREGEREKYF